MDTIIKKLKAIHKKIDNAVIMLEGKGDMWRGAIIEESLLGTNSKVKIGHNRGLSVRNISSTISRQVRIHHKNH